MGTLYNRISQLCERDGISAYKMCRDLQISRGWLSDLKNGRRTGANGATLQKIAEYFNVPIEYLLGGDVDTSATVEPPLAKYLEELRERPETRALLEAVSGMSKEDVEKMANMIRAFRGGRN